MRLYEGVIEEGILGSIYTPPNFNALHEAKG